MQDDNNYVSPKPRLEADEPAIDLLGQIDDELRAADLLILALRSQPVSYEYETAALLSELAVTRDQLILLKTQIFTICRRVLVEPDDDHYLILAAIGRRLDAALGRAGLEHASIEHLMLLLNTLKQGLRTAEQMMSP